MRTDAGPLEVVPVDRRLRSDEKFAFDESPKPRDLEEVK